MKIQTYHTEVHLIHSAIEKRFNVIWKKCIQYKLSKPDEKNNVLFGQMTEAVARFKATAVQKPHQEFLYHYLPVLSDHQYRATSVQTVPQELFVPLSPCTRRPPIQGNSGANSSPGALCAAVAMY